MALNFKDILMTELLKSTTVEKPVIDKNCKIRFVTREQFLAQRNVKIKESL